jgi:hypothetical protein
MLEPAIGAILARCGKPSTSAGPCEVTEMGLGNGMLSSPGSAPIPADAEAIAGPLRSSWSAGAHSQAPVYPPGIVRNEGLLSI